MPGILACERVELRKALGCAAPPCRGAQIEKATAADRTRARRIAKHIAVAGRSGCRLTQDQLDISGIARPDWLLSQRNDTRLDFIGSMVEPHRCPVRDGLRFAGENTTLRIDAIRRRVQLGLKHHIAAPNCTLGDPIAGEIECATLPGLTAL